MLLTADKKPRVSSMLIHRFPPPYMAAKPALSFGRVTPIPPEKSESPRPAIEYVQAVVNFIIKTRPPNQRSHGWTEYDAEEYATDLADLKQPALVAFLAATKIDRGKIIEFLEAQIQQQTPHTTVGVYKAAALGAFKLELSRMRMP